MDSAVKPQNDHIVFYSYINQLFVVRQICIFRAEISVIDVELRRNEKNSVVSQESIDASIILALSNFKA
jgi:hypothetical protein